MPPSPAKGWEPASPADRFRHPCGGSLQGGTGPAALTRRTIRRCDGAARGRDRVDRCRTANHRPTGNHHRRERARILYGSGSQLSGSTRTTKTSVRLYSDPDPERPLADPAVGRSDHLRRRICRRGGALCRRRPVPPRRARRPPLGEGVAGRVSLQSTLATDIQRRDRSIRSGWRPRGRLATTRSWADSTDRQLCAPQAKPEDGARDERATSHGQPRLVGSRSF